MFCFVFLSLFVVVVSFALHHQKHFVDYYKQVILICLPGDKLNHISNHMFNWRGFLENQLHDENAELTSGRLKLHVKSQLIVSHLSSSQFLPVKNIEARNVEIRPRVHEKNKWKTEIGGKRERFILISS